MATQSSRQSLDPCVKVLAREAVSVCNKPAQPTLAWLQGYVVWMSPTASKFALDDGSGVMALVDASHLGDIDVGELRDHSIVVGSYALVAGKPSTVHPSGDSSDMEIDVVAKPRPVTERVLISATTVRNLSKKKNAAMLEALWHCEVVETWLDIKEAY